MAKDMPKPRGFGAFDTLARKLVKVPKEAADEAMRKPKRRKKK
jgi:hypothetical protein